MPQIQYAHTGYLFFTQKEYILVGETEGSLKKRDSAVFDLFDRF